MSHISPKAPRSRHNLEMKESLVTVEEGGRWTLHYDAEGDGGNIYESLSELVGDKCSHDPNIPKAIAFGTIG